MKRCTLILALCLCLFSFSLLSAQIKEAPKTAVLNAKEQVINDKLRLALTPAQEVKYDSIFVSTQRKIRTSKFLVGKPMEKTEQIKEYENEETVAMKKILTDKQFKTYLTLLDERKARSDRRFLDAAKKNEELKKQQSNNKK